jgi:voltage-gated potassium channel Kch
MSSVVVHIHQFWTGLVQKGFIGCSLFVTTRNVAFVLLSFLISVSVVILSSLGMFSLLLTAKASSANLIPLL